jgi:putative ubiquitin-RnfH superfamily antitoxin RatB of RatAB toxin-antitoxin module
MGDASGKRLRVEVVYALPERQVLIELEVEKGTTVGEALDRSGVVERVPGLRIVPGRVGVFGKVVDPGALVRDGDRVEIYRPLVVSPGDARRERAKKPGKSRR